MKQAFLFFSLLLFFGACRKTEYEYVVTGEVANNVVNYNRQIIITDNTGETIGRHILLPGQTTFSFSVSVKTKKDLPDMFDAHFLDFDTLKCRQSIYSQFDIPNGAHFFLGYNNPVASKVGYTVKIEDVFTFKDLYKLDVSFSNGPEPYFDSIHHVVYFSFFEPEQQGVGLKLRANNEEGQYLYYLFSSALVPNDTVTLKWQDFHPANSTTATSIPGIERANGLFMYAYAENLKEYVKISTFEEDYDIHDHSFIPKFFLTPEIPEAAQLSVALYLGDTYCSRFFGRNEPIAFEEPGMKIEDYSIGVDAMTVHYTGDAEWIIGDVDIFDSDKCGRGDWQIAGPASAFNNHKMPDFLVDLPGFSTNSFALEPLLTIARYDNLEVGDIRDGYINRATFPYAVAKSGLVSVSKWK